MRRSNLEVMPGDVRSEAKRFLDYVSEHGTRPEFLGCFWRNCEPLPRDFTQYSNFTESLRGHDESVTPSNSESTMQVVENWLPHGTAPKLGQFLRGYLRLGVPKSGWVWLNTRHSHGYALPIGEYIQVPISITRWEDVSAVVASLRPTEESFRCNDKDYAFGFLLGMMIGDSNKWKKGNWHRHINLTLSKRYETNLALGEFTSEIARSLGLKTHRGTDLVPMNKPHGFYVWTSESSPLLDWMFNVCMGLRDGQHTTYDEIKADWTFEAPRMFRLGLLHGLAESDGSVSLSSKTIELWTGPSWTFGERLLSTFGIHSFRSREAISITKNHARNAARLPIFSPYPRTIRYQKSELLGSATVLSRLDRYPKLLRERIQVLAKTNITTEELVETKAKETGTLVSYEAVTRWIRNSGSWKRKNAGNKVK